MKKLLDLQLFADEPAEPDTPPSPNEPNEPNEPTKPEAKYTDEDVDKIIAQKFAAWEKKQSKATEEAKESERLKNMTDQEKKDLEFKQLQEKIASYEQREALGAMAKVARSMLAEESININDELLSGLVAKDADTTKANVENFVMVFNAAVQKEVAAKLKHEPPVKGSKSNMTKDEILKVVNRSERQKLIKENMDLFK